MTKGGPQAPVLERRTICFPDRTTQGVLQHGDSKFMEELVRLYSPSENNALEAVINLKAQLQHMSTDDFWTTVTERLASIIGADMTFVMKRMLVDERNAAVEMPPHGAPGSCMMAAALHYRANDGSTHSIRENKFHAYGCPCAYMRHDRVFLIPEDLDGFITNNPNTISIPVDAYLAVPLFAEGKCIAHFGALWSKEAAARLGLSWAFLEMLLHTLEDVMCSRLVEGSNFLRPSAVPREKQRIIPHEAVTMAQSLRPYAGSLSHELRTPMQGVVGMLDVMYATVQEAVETQPDPKLRKIFEHLKDNIEVVQDSSRRAVEAADNVVHAYDMNMSVPEAPPLLSMEESNDSQSPYSAMTDRRPEILVAGSNLPLSRPNKRRREDGSPRKVTNGNGSKFRRVEGLASVWPRDSEPSQGLIEGVQEAEEVQAHAQSATTIVNAQIVDDAVDASAIDGTARVITPGLRHTNMREVFQHIISEGLKVGGRPDSATAAETEHGEQIEVHSKDSDGTASSKTIEWSVAPGVPSTMFIDEKDLSKLISCVFLNALKFTDHVDGRIGVHAKMSARGRFILITISDNGPGIPAAFLPKLFKPFTQENGSLTRPSEGLGLGLMVAKGIARKLGGDLMCTRAETEGPNHGSAFEVRLPVMAGETISRPSSPFNSPLPRRATPTQADTPPLPSMPSSPAQVSQALHTAVHHPPLSCGDLLVEASTPPSPKTQDKQVRLAVPLPDHLEASSSRFTPTSTATPRPRVRKSVSNPEIDRNLALKYPLSFLVVEDNKINRKLLVSMLSKLGYKAIHEAHDGTEAVRLMSIPRPPHDQIDVVLMDLWMPLMDGYEATERILRMEEEQTPPTVLAVTADVTEGALERAAAVGMTGFMTKPYKMIDLQRLITEYCARTVSRSQSSRGA